MKTIKILLITALAMIGVVASVMPTIAATHPPAHPAFYTHDGVPTPTPTPFQRDGDDCSAGC